MWAGCRLRRSRRRRWQSTLRTSARCAPRAERAGLVSPARARPRRRAAARAQVHAVRKSGRFAWIEFASLQSAQQALALDGESMGTGTMKVSASKTPIHTAGWRAQARAFSSP